MRYLAAMTAALALLAPMPAQAQSIQVTRIDSRPASVGPERYFTGTAIISPLFNPHSDGGAGGAEVAFAPGARTVWHSHPAGQILVVTSGSGWVQERGGERREIKAGDVVWIPPDMEHWHGATSTNALTHIVIQEAVDGRVVQWLETVSDDDYVGR